MEWKKVSDGLPDVDYCYVLAVRKYHTGEHESHVCHTFFIKDRDTARRENPYYSRKFQGKDSVHFKCSESGFIVTHWMPLPPPPIE
ncbi:Protein of uncharacterised function (DUF551) [Cedecea lapagei]|uniref:Protein of uncharacterized function (DUF551) n=1 Tax=Cedecea lapagei TaxID=158823 RepID=A0A3S4IG25_9ENTR|nr:Protein of uncharacterised function (DUF551) [Cedecea lapagei]